ncbi:hypothetical protein TNCV_3930531 [Trichonephila clavipes]|nr:hypothetical protein TNCV_3930531 [Trichonephila clavipes]
MYNWSTAVSPCGFDILPKVDLVLQRVVYHGLVVVQAWLTRFRLAIDQENKQAKEAIQSDGFDFEKLLSAEAVLTVYFGLRPKVYVHCEAVGGGPHRPRLTPPPGSSAGCSMGHVGQCLQEG